MFNATISGNLGHDAELKQTSTGQSVCEFTVGINKGTDENRKTCWVRCSVWGKRGESLAQYLKKGTKVTCSGTFWAELYQGQNGQGLSADMQVNDIELMSPAQQQPAYAQPAYQPQPQPMPQPQYQPQPANPTQPFTLQQPATMQQMHQMAYGAPQQLVPQQPAQGELFDADIPF